jgi:sugar phosphate isomerase/epimerase
MRIFTIVYSDFKTKILQYYTIFHFLKNEYGFKLISQKSFFTMKRRFFIALSAASTAGLTFLSPSVFSNNPLKSDIRLGGPVFGKYNDPGEWIQLLRKAGYKTANCPVNPGADKELIKAYREEAWKNDIVIAEVGAWSNPLSTDAETARQAFNKCVDALALADEINARCCVNISGSRNPMDWDAPHADNLTPATFDLIVEMTRKIIDAVKPSRTFFTLEMMPWMVPDSADSCLKLIKDINRKQFAVHLDPVNMVTSPTVYYRNGDMIRDAFKKLGPHIRCVHAKDILIKEDTAQIQFEEVRPGLGTLDYTTLLKEISKCKDVPLLIEHLNSSEEYDKAAKYIRLTGQSAGISVSEPLD